MPPTGAIPHTYIHTILTDEQSEELERMQRLTLKTIYGFETPYRICLEKSGITRLLERRNTLFENFAKRAFKDDHYGKLWFHDKEKSKYNLRREERVVENFANCDRLKNAPIYRMRRFFLNKAPSVES